MQLLSARGSADESQKFLWELSDGYTIESVVLPRNLKSKKNLRLWPNCHSSQTGIERLTLCVSSQVGCAMACGFCVTGTLGLKRNLTAQEIIDQVTESQKKLGKKITNIVFMGMGEPLHNLSAVIPAIEFFKDSKGLGLSRRKITVSTSGLVPQMKELAKTGVRLALSLNATTNETRTRVMPINKAYSVEMTIQAAQDYAKAVGQTVMLEYVLLDGVNNSDEDLMRLRNLAMGWNCKVNLIPFNSAGVNFQLLSEAWVRPSEEKVKAFQHGLVSHGITSTVRYSGGEDIQAACGNLAARKNSLNVSQ